MAAGIDGAGHDTLIHSLHSRTAVRPVTAQHWKRRQHWPLGRCIIIIFLLNSEYLCIHFPFCGEMVDMFIGPFVPAQNCFLVSSSRTFSGVVRWTFFIWIPDAIWPIIDCFFFSYFLFLMQRSEPQPANGRRQAHPPRTQLAAKFVSQSYLPICW